MTKHPRLLDPSFKYVHSTKTNVAATFARIRREQKQAEQPSKPSTVRPLRRSKP